MASQRLSFSAAPAVGRAAYVPRPIPLETGKYTLWTHYCPLWKEGTHTGWRAIEPWPERKPVLGWYNEGDPEVADWHIKMMREHGITGVIYCWYRTNNNAPVKQTLGHALHDGLLKAKYLPMISFGIMWENGCGQGCGSADDLLNNLLPFWIENYFSHPSYLQVDGQPVLYIWVPHNVTRDLGGKREVRRTFETMRAIVVASAAWAVSIWWAAWAISDRQTLQTMAREGWDASTAYGNGWRQPARYKRWAISSAAPYEGFVAQQEQIWKAQDAATACCPTFPAAMMGWDSRPWNETPFFWSDNTPEKFRDLCRRAKAVMDAGPGTGPATTR